MTTTSGGTRRNRSGSSARLQGIAAKEAVLKFLASPSDEIPNISDRLIERNLRAVAVTSEGASPADKAVLVRQLVGHFLGQSDDDEITVPGDGGWPDIETWGQFGMSARRVSRGMAVRSLPWTPTWLDSPRDRSVDIEAARADMRNRSPEVDGDPFLTGLKVPGYRSTSQKTAIRAALMAPPGSTLLVTLPTGDGKSLVYLSVARFGYKESPGPDGVTIVVVPTIALAIDQRHAAIEHGLLDKPRAFLGGDPNGTNDQIIEGIRNGTQGLVFAAPESVDGRLRVPLEQAARAGNLKALVIDEAHLVHAWGANFRPSFQVLSGIRKSFLALSPPDKALRTILLSATVTSDALETLRTLFSEQEIESADQTAGMGIVSGARLRPEIEYWAASPSSEDIRGYRVEEALRHLPRPAILYTTRVRDADLWFNRAKTMGFQRVAKMTGLTSTAERDDIIRKWRAGDIDLVIGTSAFGLGISNPHVRTVIHACIPESLDRFYQEVGRSGRDGRTSISMVIPSFEDDRVAQNFARSSLISIDIGFGRWSAMYHHHQSRPLGNQLYRLRVDVPPADDIDRMDMVGEENTKWNQRTLTMLANTGLIELREFESISSSDDDANSNFVKNDEDVEESPEFIRFQTIYVAEPLIDNIETWRSTVEPYRAFLTNSRRQGLQSMNDALKGDRCISRVLAPMYQISAEVTGASSGIRPAKACGGCAHCRRADTPLIFSSSIPLWYPWSIAKDHHSVLDALVDRSKRALVFTPTGGSATRRENRRFHSALSTLIISGVRSWAIDEGAEVDINMMLENVPWPIAFVESWSEVGELPPGPTVYIGGPESDLTPGIMEPDPTAAPRVFMVPDETPHPERPDRPLKGNYPVTWISLSRLFEKLVT